MNRTIPINPVVLRWARETAGYSLEEVVQKLNRKTVTTETVSAWESGESSPNYIQLEDLAYNIYKRPLALFFFPEPPVEETPQQAFRTLPESEIQSMSPRMRFLLRQAKSMQINLDELYGGVNPAEHQIVRDLTFAPDAPIAELTSAVRRFLGVELSEQFEWKSAEKAFAAWRNALESCGLFVFKEAFREDAVSGFCLYDKRFPLIYVNNSKAYTRQIFTLFHELAHLLSGTGGIDQPIETYINLLRGRNKLIEVLCNRFAASFLVPEEDFDQRIKQLLINDDSVSGLAVRYSVSREVILRRLLDKRLVTLQSYEYMIAQWRKEAGGRSGMGGDYYRTKGVYLGERYLELAFSRLYQNKISVDQLADYLGVKAKNIAGMEALLFSKGTAA